MTLDNFWFRRASRKASSQTTCKIDCRAADARSPGSNLAGFSACFHIDSGSPRDRYPFVSQQRCHFLNRFPPLKLLRLDPGKPAHRPRLSSGVKTVRFVCNPNMGWAFGFSLHVLHHRGQEHSITTRLQCIQFLFSKTLFDFKKSISGLIELKFSGKTPNEVLYAPIYFLGVYF